MNKDLQNLFATKFYPITSALMLALVAPSMVMANNNRNLISEANNGLQQQVSGVVTAGSSPLSGVTIYVKENSTIATSTDANGRYSIKVSAGQTLVFSAVGFDKVEKPVQGSTVNVVLVASNEALEEVVVVGYGSQKRKV